MPTLTYPTVDYGPLEHLVGTWTGDKGMDVSPAPDGQTEDPYFETITIVDAGNLQNGKQQSLSMVRYLQVVSRKSDGGVFHDQTGYWMWDPETNVIMQSVAIPRGLTLVAGGHVAAEYSADAGIPFTVEASDAAGSEWLISQSPFLKAKARTTHYAATFTVTGDQLHYNQTTSLEIYGRSFDHTDTNTLTRQD